MHASVSALAGVPPAYITQQLHALAPLYWGKPESANCTILIPLPRQRSGSRRSDVDAAPRMSLRLHSEYLASKSVLLRGLLSGVSPLDLVQNMFASRAKASSIPHTRLPRLLPSSSPSHPVVFLPVPDPSSIQLLIHWVYFGSTDQLEIALDQRQIHWEGLVRNVEYLGLPTDIKVFLGRWYRNWLLPPRGSPCPSDDEEDPEPDLTPDYGDSDDDSDYPCPPSTPPTECDDPDRGRGRDIKALFSLSL